MLTHLYIRNLAVIDEVDLELHSGFSALTGETGAGKSILFDALTLCLGGRADAGVVRTGAPRAEIIASFGLHDRPDLLALLREQELDEGEDCLLRRMVGADGRSRGYVNGRTVPLQVLRDLGARLVDICGQQAHQSLRHRGVQRDLLDSHGGLQPLLAGVAAAHMRWQAAVRERDGLHSRDQGIEQRTALLRHQLAELDALNPGSGELPRLEQEQQVLSHAARLIEGINLALFRLHEQDGAAALDGIGAARRLLDELQRYDPTLQPPLRALGEAEIQVQEAAALLRDRLQALEHDPQHLEQLEERIAALQALARKHRVDADDLASLHQRLGAELDGLEQSAGQLEALEERCAALLQELTREAATLTRARQQAAAAFAAEVTRNLQALGMESASFAVSIVPRPGGEIGATGADRVEFIVSPNPGQAPGPVDRVASGGELSRLNLAIQVSAMDRNAVPTLLFDEVDAGIGGGIAEIVGRKLRSLSHTAQVLCVTHLPQVASQATHHFRVSKQVRRGATHTRVELLDASERIEETARMLGGLKITAQTRAHAREMLDAAGN